jgi:hypothetical protein
MKITRKQLRQIIQEEKAKLFEIGKPPDTDNPGWHPNDSQEWERQARYEDRAEMEAEKEAFMAKELPYWYAEFEVEKDGHEQLVVIKDKLSDCYNAIYKELIDPYGDVY